MKKLKLTLIDLISLTLMAFLSSWIVRGTLNIDYLFSVAMIVCYIAVLHSTKFYNYRIENSSLFLVRACIMAMVPVTVVFFAISTIRTGIVHADTRWVITNAVFSFCAVLLPRLVFRMLKDKNNKETSELPSALVYGAGDCGTAMARQACRGKFDYRIAGFIDDNEDLQGRIVIDFPVLGTGTDLDKVLASVKPDTLIIAISKISSDKIQTIAQVAKKHEVKLKIVPNLFETKGRSEVSVRDIDYADLLGRNLITIEKEPLFEMFGSKTILVTGAVGSIGSEICTQLTEYGLKKLILLDIDESGLHDLSLRLLNYEHEWSEEIVPVVCDIRNREKLSHIINKYKPDIVFHAAAYKHVPLMEMYPEEAVVTNICGSYNLFKSAKEAGVSRVVVISTDKAVNPTNIMGSTKRVVEMMAASLNCETIQFCCVRFGNVIGSRGSMLPLFLEQIKAGRPITVTDRRIIRYFMAIPEAVGLVFRAATLAKGGEVMVLDMGEPVNIYDFAMKLISVFGDERSSIKITGLRPGEKLYEELLANRDNTIPTENQKIFKAKVVSNTFTEEELDKLIAELPSYSSEKKVEKLKEMVPEYRPTSN